MSNVKPAEISAILRQQLSGFASEAQLEEVGTVLQIGDGIARAYGMDNAQSGELVEFENGLRGIVLNLEEDNVGIVLLGPAEGIKEGSTVKRTGVIASINVGEGMVGRVVDTLGNPMDGKGPIEGERFEMPLERKAPGVIYRQPVNEPLQTGIKAIDAMIPIGRGQRELIIGDRQTGKTTVASLLAERLGCTFQDGDDLHPRENVEKMRSGTPLNDADRLPWLEAIAGHIDGWRERGEAGVITCSALKRTYRDIIVGRRADANLVYLKGTQALIHGRLMARTSHFMPVGLLDNQFATLQEPAEDERPIVVDIGPGPPQIVEEIVRKLAARG